MDSLCSTIPTPDQPRPDMTFTVGERVWVSAEGTDGGDAGYATLIAIRDNGTCDLRDDNGAEYWSLLSHLSRVDQPRPDAAAMEMIWIDALGSSVVDTLRDKADITVEWSGMRNAIQREVDRQRRMAGARDQAGEETR